MSHDKWPDYLLYRNIIRKSLLIVGLWPEEKPKILYRFLPFPFLFANTFVTLGIIFYIKMHSLNFNKAMKGLSMMPSFLTVNLKIICVMIHRDEAITLHNLLDLHYTELLSDQRVSKAILTGSRIFRNLSWVFTLLGVIIISTIAMTPIISLIDQQSHAVNPIHYPHVYPTKYPWSSDPLNFSHKIHFFIEYVAVVTHFCASHLDALFMMYGYQMICQFREMSHRITHIDVMTFDITAIKQCVQQHQLMMKCRDIMQRIFGPILLVVWSANAISMCSFIFQITQIKSISIPMMMTSTGYVVLKLLQTFIYAFTGTCLTSESVHYQQAIYDADWQRNRRFMTSILIMLTQEPIILTACSFSVISLDLFIKVSTLLHHVDKIKFPTFTYFQFLNATVSYFFLLQAVS
uniref:Odorant receptor n=1 Tax=Meteorus pulchricornis TaxID=51522 RepID=A0A1S5VFQ5_9HYME|nr:olfactory receptor 67 [Meteorus pulchricornis]